MSVKSYLAKKRRMRLTPSLPSISSAEYCKALAMPKNTVHNTPLVVSDSGRSIWAKDNM